MRVCADLRTCFTTMLSTRPKSGMMSRSWNSLKLPERCMRPRTLCAKQKCSAICNALKQKRKNRPNAKPSPRPNARCSRMLGPKVSPPVSAKAMLVLLLNVLVLVGPRRANARETKKTVGPRRPRKPKKGSFTNRTILWAQATAGTRASTWKNATTPIGA